MSLLLTFLAWVILFGIACVAAERKGHKAAPYVVLVLLGPALSIAWWAWAERNTQWTGSGFEAPAVPFELLLLGSGILALLAAAVIPAAKPAMKRCPECAELLRLDARICRYCRHHFEDAGL